MVDVSVSHCLARDESVTAQIKKPPQRRAAFSGLVQRDLALAGFEPTLRFVDHVNAAFATHNTAVAMPILERAERIANLHGRSPHVVARASAWVAGSPLARTGYKMVGDTGIEPVTPSMSTKCSTAELIVRVVCVSSAL